MKFLWINIVLACAGSIAKADTLDAFLRNREGVQHLKNKEMYPAYQQFLKALDSEPLNPSLHLNLALALEANEEYEKAETAYRSALELLPPDSPQRFEPLFNLAGVQAKLRKIDVALETYQKALEIQPDSKEVKTNIELLWQGGQGEGDGQSQNDQNKEGKQKSPQDQKQDGKPEEQKEQPKKEQKPQPKSFESQQLTPQDVKKILDEIKNQEQGIRAQDYEKGAKDAPKGKDW